MQFRVVRVVASLVVCAVAVGCGPPPLPNFGDLKSDSRKLSAKNSVVMLELSNGMKVALAPDDRTNLVSVDVRYLVGAAQDPKDRSGLAHLLEHLTFQVVDGNGRTLWDKLSGLAQTFNAYTNHDFTHYTATVLAPRAPALIELEARRLEARCADIPEASFVRERDVVLEEEAQRAGGGELAIQIGAQAWGEGHPYTRGVGTREVAKATKAEACAMFDAYYAPRNAIMVVTGNFEPKAMQARIGERFGPITKVATATAKPVAPGILTGSHRDLTADIDRPIALVLLAAPAWGSEEATSHDLILAAMRSALYRLDDRHDWIRGTVVGYLGTGYRRLTVIGVEVTDKDRLDDAVKGVMGAGKGILEDDDRDGNANDDDDPDDRAVRHQFGQMIARQMTNVILASDRQDGRGYLLANYLTYTSTFDFAIGDLAAADHVDANGLRAYAAKLFAAERTDVVSLLPSGAAATGGGLATVAVAEREYDLPTWRAPVDAAAATSPEPLAPNARPIEIEHVELTNGLRVLMYAQPASPVFEARMVFPSGRVDEPDDKRGVAAVAPSLLWHDFDRSYPFEVAQRINWVLGVGTTLDGAAGDDVTVFVSRGLATFGDWHLFRLSWLLDQGVYDAETVADYQRDLRQADATPASAGWRTFLTRLYGPGHRYARPSITAAELAQVDRAALQAWRSSRFVPRGATLIVTGGFDAAEMRRHVIELFGDLPGRAPPSRPELAAPTPRAAWIGARDESASQVRLFISYASTSDRSRDRAARKILAAIIDDRLRVVREGMGASYGVSSAYDARAAGSTLDIESSLDPVRAPRAAAAVLAAIDALRADPKAFAEDFVRARRRLVSLAMASSTDVVDVADQLEGAVISGRDPDDVTALATGLATTTLDDLARVVAADLDPTRRVVYLQGRSDPLKATFTGLGSPTVEWFDE